MTSGRITTAGMIGTGASTTTTTKLLCCKGLRRGAGVALNPYPVYSYDNLFDNKPNSAIMVRMETARQVQYRKIQSFLLKQVYAAFKMDDAVTDLKIPANRIRAMMRSVKQHNTSLDDIYTFEPVPNNTIPPRESCGHCCQWKNFVRKVLDSR